MILDVALPDINGLELQQMLVASDVQRIIVFLTGRGDIPSGIRAMRAGAVHFLTKPVRDGDLPEAIHEALQKDGQARLVRAESTRTQKRLATLKPREREVLQHVVAGRLNKQIAAELGTVEKTVKVHRAPGHEQDGGPVIGRTGAHHRAPPP